MKNILSIFTKVKALAIRLQARPAQLLILSFAGTTFIGAILLSLPVATSDSLGASLIDALFTATSAVCVTGLIVQDTPTYFSTFGQMVILFLMQVGGIGIMTITTSLALMLGRRFSIREQRAMQDIMEESSFTDLKHTIASVVKLTVIVESIGAFLLFIRWAFEKSFSESLYFAVFHSVSAFCNAGFSLFGDSLEGYSGDILINGSITTLIILGGLGFTVVSELIVKYRQRVSFRSLAYWLYRFFRYLSLRGLRTDNIATLFRKASQKPPPKIPATPVLKVTPRILKSKHFTVHSRLVLLITGLLIASGTILFFFFEYDNSIFRLPLREKILASYFQSVTLRTAGFNTINIGSLMDFTLFFMIIFMFIGASPNSTAGGIKTSTLGLLLLSIRAMLLGRDEVEVYSRTVPKQIVYKAVSIVVISFILLIFFFMVLLIYEKQPFLDLLFEATSAFGTVGLSTGITPKLRGMGKFIIICLMFTGRTGPFTLAVAVGEQRDRAAIVYPECKVMVG